MKAMSFTRRSLALATAAALSFAVLPQAHAQGTLELKITAPAGAGGGWDSTSRALQQVMTGIGAAKSVQVVNVPGASGTIGLTQFATTGKGDGNQLLMMGFNLVGAVMTTKSQVTLEQTTPIARLTGDALVIVVPANSPHKTVKDLAAALKADTTKVVWNGGSAGGADHILAALVTKAAGGDAAKLNYVPFSGGGEALAELLGGRVTAGISSYNEFESMIKAGKLRAIAVSSAARVAGIDVPTIKEGGLDVELMNWRGIVAAPGITPAQKAALVAAVDKAVKSPEWAAIRKQRSWDDAYLGADAFSAFLKSENARMKDTLTTVGLLK
jgi:putative tricarboxylic transport membrane protein